MARSPATLLVACLLGTSEGMLVSEEDVPQTIGSEAPQMRIVQPIQGQSWTSLAQVRANATTKSTRMACMRCFTYVSPDRTDLGLGCYPVFKTKRRAIKDNNKDFWEIDFHFFTGSETFTDTKSGMEFEASGSDYDSRDKAGYQIDQIPCSDHDTDQFTRNVALSPCQPNCCTSGGWAGNCKPIELGRSDQIRGDPTVLQNFESTMEE